MSTKKLQKPEKLVIVQPSPFCNLDCKYCYLPNREDSKIMGMNTVKSIAQILFNSTVLKEGFTIVWHAGEPLSVGTAFYEKAFGIIKDANVENVPVKHSFQTNATLINQKWCDFFKTNSVRIGVSVDGPAFLHDSSRVYRNGNGTFNAVMRGIQYLKSNAVDFGTITVLRRDSLDYPDEIWKFFVDNDLKHVAFNPEEAEGVHKISTLNKLEFEEKYKTFFSRILELWLNSTRVIDVREIDQSLDRILNKLFSDGTATSSTENQPLGIINFDFEGNVSTFSPELLTSIHKQLGTLSYGNISNITKVEDILKDLKFGLVNSEVSSGIEKCRTSCDYFSVCGGGAPSNKLTEHGSFDTTETSACRIKIKATVDAVTETLMRMDKDDFNILVEERLGHEYNRYIRN